MPFSGTWPALELGVLRLSEKVGFELIASDRSKRFCISLRVPTSPRNDASERVKAICCATRTLCASSAFTHLASPKDLIIALMQGAIRNVIFLGAGASKADGAPLQVELLREYFRLPQDESRREMDLELSRFFKAFYNIDTTQLNPRTEFPTFEEVLGTIELALGRDENFRVSGEIWDQHRIQQCREHVIFLICVVLAEKLGTSPSPRCHRRLLAKLAPTSTTCFVSLNYDLLIDNAISDWNTSIDYGIEFTNPLPMNQEVIALYKLHGSLNWLRCPTCGSLTNTGNMKGASYPAQKREPCGRRRCGGQTDANRHSSDILQGDGRLPPPADLASCGGSPGRG